MEDDRIKRMKELIDLMNSEQTDQAINVLHSLLGEKLNIDDETP